MENNIYLVKKVSICKGDLISFKVDAFLKEKNALKYIKSDLNSYKFKGIKHVIYDGFNSLVYDKKKLTYHYFGIDFMPINEYQEVSEGLFAYTQISYKKEDLNNLHFKALGFFKEIDAVKQLNSDVQSVENQLYEIERISQNLKNYHQTWTMDNYYVQNEILNIKIHDYDELLKKGEKVSVKGTVNYSGEYFRVNTHATIIKVGDKESFAMLDYIDGNCNVNLYIDNNIIYKLSI